MADTTVPTPPATQQPQRAAGTEWTLTTETMTIPTSRSVVQTGDGMTMVAIVPDRRLPGEYRGRVSYTIPLHADGSPCSRECDCAATAVRHEIHAGTPRHFGDWTGSGWVWAANAVALIGWTRTGPNAAERDLQERLRAAEEDYAGEQILHDLTREDLAASQQRRAILRTSRRGALRRALQRATSAEHKLSAAVQVAYAGWSAALILAAHLIERVL